MRYSQKEIRELLLKAIEAFNNKEYRQALVILRDIIKNNPDSADAHRNLGLLLMHSPSQKEALQHLQKAVALDPDNGENRMSLGRFYVACKEWDQALDSFEKALKLPGNTFQVWREIMLAHSEKGNHNKAQEIARQLLSKTPNNAVLLTDYAKILEKSGLREDALMQYRTVVESGINGLSIETIENWYSLMLEYRFITEARSYLKHLTENNPENVALLILHAKICEADQDDAIVLEVYQKAYALAPENLSVSFGLAISLIRMGNIEEGKQILEAIIHSNPGHIPALHALANMHQFKKEDTLFQKLKSAEQHMAEFPLSQQALLHYSLGKAYDHTGNLAVAFEHYRQGGMLQANNAFDNDYHVLERQYMRAGTILTRDFFNSHKKEGYSSSKPVFIVGMPRSGTSLMEQVLTSFESVFGAGEMNYLHDVLNDMEISDYKLDFGRIKSPFPETPAPSFSLRGQRFVERMESLAPADAQRIIDKTPGYFIWLGYLHLILPEARFIHARRHPVETCLSAYRIHFADGHYWSCDLRTMGRYYRFYTEIMLYWKKVLPPKTLLEVRYEDMVNNLETESKRLADFLEMEWNPSCLDFHKNKRPVRTASVAQVRQPLHKNSVNRWRKYEPYLQPLLDEIGDLVEEYEAELKQ